MTSARRDIVGGAVATTLTSGINATALTLPIAASTGWPPGVNEFYVCIDRGLSTEEKVLCASRSGLNITVASTGKRGADGTSAQSHTSGATIEHCGTAVDLDDANDHIYTTTRDDHTQYLKASTAAGDGLGIASRVLSVNVDASTIETNADTLRVKDSGVTLPKLANLANATVIGRNTAGTGVPEAVTMAQLRTLLSLVIGTNVQAWDADLDAIAALVSAANKMPYSTGAQAWALADLTAFARSILDDADAAAVRATLGLGTLATLSTIASANITDGTITGADMAASDFIKIDSAYQTSADNPYVITTSITAIPGTLVTMAATRAAQIFKVWLNVDVDYTGGASPGFANFGLSIDGGAIVNPKIIGYLATGSIHARITFSQGPVIVSGLSVASHTFQLKGSKDASGDTVDTNWGQTGIVVERVG